VPEIVEGVDRGAKQKFPDIERYLRIDTFLILKCYMWHGEMQHFCSMQRSFYSNYNFPSR
jgi:hypothetical protein